MPNRISIEPYQKVYKKADTVSHCIDIYDDYYFVTLCVAESDIPEDDLSLLKKVIELIRDEDTHGSSCDDVREILQHARDNDLGMFLNFTTYTHEQLKEIYEAI